MTVLEVSTYFTMLNCCQITTTIKWYGSYFAYKILASEQNDTHSLL